MTFPLWERNKKGAEDGRGEGEGIKVELVAVPH